MVQNTRALVLGTLLIILMVVGAMVAPSSQQSKMAFHSMHDQQMSASTSHCCDSPVHEQICTICYTHFLALPVLVSHMSSTYPLSITLLISKKPVRRIELLERPPKEFESVV